MKLINSFLILILFSIVTFGQTEPLKLWYDKPAEKWTEALPVGNGRQGAMIFGNPLNEHFQLNENTLYSGEPSSTYKNVNIQNDLPMVIKMLEEEKYVEADKYVTENWLGRLHQNYQPFGDLYLNFEGNETEISNFQRDLDISNSIAKVTYNLNRVNFTREVFASFPDQIIAIRISSDKKSAISFGLNFNSVHPNCISETPSNHLLVFKGQAPGFVSRRTLEHIESKNDQHKYPEIYNADGTRKPNAKQVLYGDEIDGKGMFFEAQLEVRNLGGKAAKTDNGLQISGADEVVLLLSMATSYNGFDKSPSREGKNPAEINSNILEKVKNKSWNEIVKRHQTDYKNLFNRVNFELKSDDYSGIATVERLKNYADNRDFNLNTLLFQYGRYLMISGSRTGGQPMNLQGIWNAEIIPPWNSGYTINMNTEMNYWPAEVANLSECHEPLFRLIKECVVNGQETAKNMYGNRGWVVHHNVDIWRPTYPVDNQARHSFWPVAQGWLTSHMWEHYLFTEDDDFLKNELYPVIKGAAEFYADWLIENKDGYLLTPVSTTPENAFYTPKGEIATVSQGTTMDMAIIKETFARTIEASEKLGIDKKLSDELKEKQTKLLPYKIGKKGQLQEWEFDFEEPEPEHRHLAHLYGFHPGDQITKEKTPDLFEPVRKTLELRGDAATGWSMGWKINFWARMYDGDHAQKIIKNFFNYVEDGSKQYKGGGLYPNLFDAHPPFQIDGNFGYTAGVAEMLLQSHESKIRLLPALPTDWSGGKISGLKARGNIEVSMEWENGKLIQATLISGKNKTALVDYNGKTIEIVLKENQPLIINSENFKK
ncbi:MAG TPA: glycoside hydrolase family 95 protein [Draconibacterium sp.]|nr:glycoside hydrolase family 95 protein [Draconibacterium sp.]